MKHWLFKKRSPLPPLSLSLSLYIYTPHTFSSCIDDFYSHSQTVLGYRLLVGKPEGKRPLGRSRRRWRDNIKMDLLEIGMNVVDWIGLAQDRYRWRALVNLVLNLRVP
jgi:hypothetical protein